MRGRVACARIHVMPDDPPRPATRARSGPLTIRWLGHSTVLLELDGMRLLTDPVLRNRVGPLLRHAPSEAPGQVDCMLLSHLHADHADPQSLRSVERSGPVLAPYPARDWLIRRGIRGVRELSSGEETQLGRLTITATRATHDGRRIPFGPAAEPVGYLIRGSRTVYFAGDTDVFGGMAELRGTVDVALLPIWGWGPSVGPGHLDPERAAVAAALIAPRVAIPIHWGTFALPRPLRGSTYPGRPAAEFVRLMQRHAPTVTVRVLEPGGSVEL